MTTIVFRTSLAPHVEKASRKGKVSTMDFGELKRDVSFVSRVTDFDQSLEEIQAQVQQALEMDVTKMSKEQRVKHDLFLCYSTNTLYYLYLKINGVNVNEVRKRRSMARANAINPLTILAAPDQERTVQDTTGDVERETAGGQSNSAQSERAHRPAIHQARAVGPQGEGAQGAELIDRLLFKIRTNRGTLKVNFSNGLEFVVVTSM